MVNNLKTSNAGRAFIEEWEGCILEAYDDRDNKIVPVGNKAKGTLTIGYGHTTSAGAPKVFVGQKIIKADADHILSGDLTKVEIDVNHLVKVKLNQNQFDVLVSFEYNTGALGTSSALKALNAGDYAKAADLLTLYNRAGGKVVEGLVKRRAAEKKIFLSPVTKNPATPVEHPAAGAIIAAGGAVTATVANQPHVWPYVLISTVVIAAVSWLMIRYFRSK